jgi:hypothetical protein
MCVCIYIYVIIRDVSYTVLSPLKEKFEALTAFQCWYWYCFWAIVLCRCRLYCWWFRGPCFFFKAKWLHIGHCRYSTGSQVGGTAFASPFASEMETGFLKLWQYDLHHYNAIIQKQDSRKSFQQELLQCTNEHVYCTYFSHIRALMVMVVIFHTAELNVMEVHASITCIDIC